MAPYILQARKIDWLLSMVERERIVQGVDYQCTGIVGQQGIDPGLRVYEPIHDPRSSCAPSAATMAPYILQARKIDWLLSMVEREHLATMEAAETYLRCHGCTMSFLPVGGNLPPRRRGRQSGP